MTFNNAALSYDLFQITLGDRDFGVGYENHTTQPAPVHIILCSGGISETEILLA